MLALRNDEPQYGDDSHIEGSGRSTATDDIQLGLAGGWSARRVSGRAEAGLERQGAGSGNRLTVEDIGEVRDDAVFDLGAIDQPPELRERRDASIGDATGHDHRKAAKVGCHVDGEPVTRHPPRNPHPNRRELVGPHPDARQSGDASGGDLEVSGRSKNRFFEISDVTVHIAAIGLEVEDGIADELSWTVIGHATAAPGLVDRNAQSGQPLVGDQHVIPATTTPDPQRHDWGVFEQQQLIGNAAGLSLEHESALQRQRIGVSDSPEATDFKRPHVPLATGSGSSPRKGIYTVAWSQPSIPRLMCDRNWSATAPSMIR
jgi:hypothetical protein